MSSPVFGREPSRPLPRDDDSDPTLDIDLNESTKSDEAKGDQEREEPGLGDESDVSAGRRPAGDDGGAEGGRERDEARSGDESAVGAGRELAGDEPVDEGGAEGGRERDEARSGDESAVGAGRELAGDEPVDEGGPMAEGGPVGLGGRERVGSQSDEPDHPGEPDQPDEPASLDVADLAGSPTPEPEASATRFDQADLDEPEVQPVVLEAEGVSAEPALGRPEPVEPEPVSAALASFGSNGFEGPWVELQLQFVDDPQRATAGALHLLREALAGLSPEGASTEDLRVAFRRYRAAYHDLARN